LAFFNLALTWSVRCTRNMTDTNNNFFFISAPGCWNHTLCNHCFRTLLSTHPFSCTQTNRPGENLSLGMVFCLNTTIGFSLVPSAMHARITVKCYFSDPDVLLVTVFSPMVFTVELPGMSKNIGVSFMLLRPSSKSNCLRCRITSWWKDITLLSTLAGSFWAMCVLWRTYIIKKQNFHIKVSTFQFLLIKVVATDEAITQGRWSFERSKVDALLLFFRQLKRFHSEGVSCYHKTALMKVLHPVVEFSVYQVSCSKLLM